MFLIIIFFQLSYIIYNLHKNDSLNIIRKIVSPILFCNFIIVSYLFIDLLNRYLELS